MECTLGHHGRSAYRIHDAPFTGREDVENPRKESQTDRCKGAPYTLCGGAWAACAGRMGDPSVGGATRASFDSSAVLEAVGHPNVLPGLLAMASGLRSPSQILPGLVPSLMASLRHAGFRPDEAVLWEHPFEDFAFHGLGRISVEGGARSLLLDASGLAVETQDGARLDVVTGGKPLTVSCAPIPVGAPELGLTLSEVDCNPLAMDEAHPDKSGNAVSLGGKPAEEWSASLEEALSLIASALPDWSAELASTTDRLVPVRFEPEMHLSASYREAPGTVYLTLHPDPLTMAEAIIHETQHGKLNRLTWLDPVLRNGYTAWSESPVRPDLRPVMGVLPCCARLHTGWSAP